MPSDEPSAPRWVWVSLPYATFGIITQNGRVVEAAPIARWAVGKPERQVADYYRRKGAQFRDLTEQGLSGATASGAGAAAPTGCRSAPAR